MDSVGLKILMTERCHFSGLGHSVGRYGQQESPRYVYLVLEKHGEDEGGRGRKERSSEVPMQGMSHRTPATQAAKLPEDQPTAFGVSHLLGPASRKHHFWGFCLLLHGQDTKDTSLCDTVFSAILPQSW